MATRIGIELSPVACRIVEIEASRGWRRGGADTRVRSFTVLPRSGGDMMAKLATLKGRQAAVVAWGVRADHRQAVVAEGRYEAMRAEAIQPVQLTGIDMRGVLTDIAPAGPRLENERRPIVLTMASGDDVAAAVRPLIAAGIRVRSVVTPAAALGSLARLRRMQTSAPAVEIYVALEDTATCIALIRNHVLVAARDLPWGYADECEPFGEKTDREEIAIRLADELEEFFSTSGIDRSVVTHVCMCGGLPELRSMTAPMMERLDVEIEPMDSLFGIDAEHLPVPTDEFRDRSVELRLAWAVAADWAAPLNLLRERRRRAASARIARAAVVAGVGAGLGVGWGVERAGRWQAPPRRQEVTRTAVVATAPDRPLAPARRPAPANRAVETPIAPRDGSRATPVAVVPPRAVQVEVAAPAEAAIRAAPPAPIRVEGPGGLPMRQLMVARRDQPETIAPFEGELGTILFGPGRKLAIVNGRIVEAGDQVGGARIVEITPTSVMLRDEAGRLRRLSVGAMGRQAP